MPKILIDPANGELAMRIKEAQQYADHKQPSKSTPYFDFNEHFGRGETEKTTGGKTGSGSAKSKLTGKTYQLKKSIKDSAFFRNAKVRGLDTENFGEIIASRIGRAVTNSSDEGLELVPKVFLVYNEKEKKFLAASRYLENPIGDHLDDYAYKEVFGKKFQEDNPHVKVTFIGDNVTIPRDGEPPKHVFSLKDQFDDTPPIKEKKALLRKDIATALAVSILVGDHDVNPGNMMVIKEKDGQKRERIARIDLGHAFHDFLGVKKDILNVLGGGVYNKNNRVLDFINRGTILNANLFNQQTKLDRDYQGVILSQEFADALNELSTPEKMKATAKGIADAKAVFAKMANYLMADPKANKEPINQLRDTLIKISANVSPKPIPSDTPLLNLLNDTFVNLQEFCVSGQVQMRQAAKLIQLQVDIDKFLVANAEGKQPDRELIEKIELDYGDIKTIRGIGHSNGKIEWVRSEGDKTAFKGTLEEYKAFRLPQIQHKINDAESKIQDVDSLKSIIIGEHFSKIPKVLERDKTIIPTTDKAPLQSIPMEVEKPLRNTLKRRHTETIPPNSTNISASKRSKLKSTIKLNPELTEKFIKLLTQVVKISQDLERGRRKTENLSNSLKPLSSKHSVHSSNGIG